MSAPLADGDVRGTVFEDIDVGDTVFDGLGTTGINESSNEVGGTVFEDAASPLSTPPTQPSLGEAWRGVVAKASPYYRPALEVGGLMGGATIGARSGAGGYGGIAGAGLLYSGGRGIADRLDEFAGIKDPPPSFAAGMIEGARNALHGSAMEATGGQIAPAAVGAAAGGIKYGSKAVGALIGKLTGTGKAAVEAAFKGSPEFTAAMRGKISGAEIVETAKNALHEVRRQRGEAYSKALDSIKGGKSVDISPIRKRLVSLAEEFGVKGEILKDRAPLDVSRSTLNKSGDRDIVEVINLIRGWGKKAGDRTAVGLDKLKRKIDDFYFESSALRGFVADLKKTIQDTISKSVPEYREMTRGYAEATSVIEDIERGLMLRKGNMDGKVIADQTLRRLNSALKDNHPLRKELLQTLEQRSGTNLSDQIAGASMRPLLPDGLAGGVTLSGGLTGGLLLHRPVSAAALAGLTSPRLMGETVRGAGLLAGAINRGSSGFRHLPVSRSAASGINLLINMQKMKEEQERAAHGK